MMLGTLFGLDGLFVLVIALIVVVIPVLAVMVSVHESNRRSDEQQRASVDAAKSPVQSARPSPSRKPWWSFNRH
jgi:uncharacterized membrane protein